MTLAEPPLQTRASLASPLDSSVNASSYRLANFLEEAGLHKKDFADMIGVSLSYVYSLIDPQLPFSTRVSTLERIAFVMEVPASSFPEHRLADDVRMDSPQVRFLKERQQQLGMSNLQLLRRLPREERLAVVDAWRGKKPLPLDWQRLQHIGLALKLEKKELFPLWESRLQELFQQEGFRILENQELYKALIDGAKHYLEC